MAKNGDSQSEENESPMWKEKSSDVLLGAVVTRVPQEYDGAGNVTAHGNLLTEYSSIEMDCLQLEAHKRYSNAIAEGDVLPPTTFKVTQLDPSNTPDHKELFYSRVDSQFVAELIKNILTDAEYAKLMLKCLRMNASLQQRNIPR